MVVMNYVCKAQNNRVWVAGEFKGPAPSNVDRVDIFRKVGSTKLRQQYKGN